MTSTTTETSSVAPIPEKDKTTQTSNKGIEETPQSILQAAWQLESDYAYNADLSVGRHRQLRESVIVLGVIATLLAILSDMGGASKEWATAHPGLVTGLRILLVIVPITASVILAMANKFQEGERWLALRTGAENIRRVICFYATILSKNPNRDPWLQERLAEIRRETLQKVTGNLALSKNSLLNSPLLIRNLIPVDDLASQLKQKTTLNPEDYIQYRLNQAIKLYSRKIEDTQRQRTRMQIMILTLGGIGSLLAALANKESYTFLGIWVAFSTAIAVALGSWLELRQTDWRVLRGMSSEEREKVYRANSEKAGSNSAMDDPLETTVAVYSHIINELSIARDHWLSLKAEDKNGNGEFYELVLLVEKILWGKDIPIVGPVQESINKASSIQGDFNKAVKSVEANSTDEEREGSIADPASASIPGLLSKGLAQIAGWFGDKKEAAETGMSDQKDPALVPASDSQNKQTLTDGKNGKSNTPVPGNPRSEGPASQSNQYGSSGRAGERKNQVKKERKVIVLMPAGRPLTSSGLKIDFENVYNRLITQALKNDSAYSVSRWDRSNPDLSLQLLLLADIVIADIGVDDPDVFYNLAVRHAFRKDGIIHIREAQTRSSFGTFNLRTADYHCNKFGRIDSSKEEADRAALLAALKSLEFNVSDSHAEDNPLFAFLPNLREPNQKDLKAPSAVDYWSEDDDRQERIALAQRAKRTGDILLLADEITNPMIQEEAYLEAGQALKELGRHDLALTWFRRGRELNPRSLFFRREEAVALNHLKRRDEAIEILESLLEDNPGDPDSIINLVRVYKGKWHDTWKEEPDLAIRRRKAYEANYWLNKIYETYLNGYRYDLNRTHLGINAFTLGTIFVYLSEECGPDGINNGSQDPYVYKLKNEILPELKGTLTFALEGKTRKEKVDYEALGGFAELQAMSGKSGQEVKRAYQRALMGTRRTRIAMQSTLRQLELVYQLQLPGVYVKPGIDALRAELGLDAVDELNLSSTIIQSGKEQSQTGGTSKQRKVFLYESDLGSLSVLRKGTWNAEIDKTICERIEAELKNVKAEDNLVIATGMRAGLDMIFVECCLKLGIKVEVYFPVREELYMERYVDVDSWSNPKEANWVDRFYKNRNHPLMDEYYQDTSLGMPSGVNFLKRNARWAKTYAELDSQEYYTIGIEYKNENAIVTVSGTRGSSDRSHEEQQEDPGEQETAEIRVEPPASGEEALTEA